MVKLLEHLIAEMHSIDLLCQVNTETAQNEVVELAKGHLLLDHVEDLIADCLHVPNGFVLEDLRRLVADKVYPVHTLHQQLFLALRAKVALYLVDRLRFAK